jgi:hypothetical protein
MEFFRFIRQKMSFPQNVSYLVEKNKVPPLFRNGITANAPAPGMGSLGRGVRISYSYLWLTPKVLPLERTKEKAIFILFFARLFVPLQTKVQIIIDE